tara:strand:+ start:13801 stop:14751 length:951 start_codon:yes stop_codon:yes gene_type:complete
LGSTAPNPMVGCVIVMNDKIIGEGYTSPHGGAHAEVNAIEAVSDKSQLKNSTLYVTLEPCSHHGKTPPCCDLIISHKIPNIVIGCIDSNKKVCGKGVTKLKANGCNVILGVEKKLCRQHHKRFLTYHEKNRPYIILKWAKTKNGFIAPNKKKFKKPNWITGKLSRKLVHKWRAEEQAILVGANTVISDNPFLTTRNILGKNPIRIVVSTRKNISKNYNVFNNDSKTILLDLSALDKELPLGMEICKKLYNLNITSVIIEGGTKTLNHFIKENLWDEARVFEGNEEFDSGIKAPNFDISEAECEKIDNDRLWILVNK